MSRYAVEQILLTDEQGRPMLSTTRPEQVIVEATGPEDAIRLVVRDRRGELITEPASFTPFSAVAVVRMEARYLCLEAIIFDTPPE